MMPFLGMHHDPYFPGSRLPKRPHNPNGLEATWLLSVAVMATGISLPIAIAILKSCDYKRPTMLLMLNIAIIDSVMSSVYIPLYMIYVLLNPVVQPTVWFCIHAQTFFRIALGSKLACFAMFSIKMFHNVHFGRKNEKSAMSSFKMFVFIFSTWFVYFIVYHPSLFSQKLGIISDLDTDRVCTNITNLYIPGKGNEESVLIASVVSVSQITQVLIVSAMLIVVFFSISNTSHHKFENSANYSETQKVTYVKAGRSTAVMLVIFLLSWIPITTVDFLLVLDYDVPHQAIHFAFHFVFLSPIGMWIIILFAIRSVRIDLGRCCAWMCCYKPPATPKVKMGSGDSESDSWMDGNATTSSGRI